MPPPAPLPPAPPAPFDAADRQLWGRVSAWAGQHHTGGNREAAQWVRAWAQAKGLAEDPEAPDLPIAPESIVSLPLDG